MKKANKAAKSQVDWKARDRKKYFHTRSGREETLSSFLSLLLLRMPRWGHIESSKKSAMKG